MLRYLLIALLIVVCCAVLSCQSYSEGMQQSVTKVDETVAIEALHAISTAQRTYSTSNGGSYGTFEQLVKGKYLDERFNSDKPKVKGYVLTMTATPEAAGSAASYTVNADPEPPQTGRHFYLDSASGVMHVNASQRATASDPATEQ